MSKYCIMVGATGAYTRLVHEICKAGKHVVLLSRKIERVKKLQEEVERHQYQGEIYYLIGDKDMVPLEYEAGTYEQIQTMFGDANILIKCIEIGEEQNGINIHIEDLKQALEHHVIGTYETIKGFLNSNTGHKEKRIVIVCPFEQGMVSNIVYGAIEKMIMSFLEEYQNRNVAITLIKEQEALEIINEQIC